MCNLGTYTYKYTHIAYIHILKYIQVGQALMYVYTHMLCEEHTQTYIYTQTHKYIHTDSHTYVQKRKHKTNTHAPTLFSLPYTLRPHSPLPPPPPYTYSGQQHQPHSSTARQSSGPSGDRVGSPSRVFCWSHAKKRK